jgi:hypothetical protein
MARRSDRPAPTVAASSSSSSSASPRSDPETGQRIEVDSEHLLVAVLVHAAPEQIAQSLGGSSTRCRRSDDPQHRAPVV